MVIIFIVYMRTFCETPQAVNIATDRFGGYKVSDH